MSNPDNVIGKIHCQCCEAVAVLLANKRGLAYYGCAECGYQGLTRARASDVILRKKVIQPATPAPKETTREEKPAADSKPAQQPRRLFGR